MRKLCAISVDLDPLTAYYKIHGLGEAPEKLRHTILRKVLPRFEELFAELGIRATFFVVGRELEDNEEAKATLRRLVEAGHEMGNHTYAHPYELCGMPEDAVAEEVSRAHRTIVDAVGAGHQPVGFRTPGYSVNAMVLRVLTNAGYLYDSSMLPSPPYYLAKLAVMAGMSLRGRHSGSVIGDPRGLLCPADPYRPDPERPWRRGRSPLIELPVAVLPRTRIPAIGTFLAASPQRLRRYMLGAMQQRRLFNLELHGIDLADAIDDRIPTELAGRQMDLRVPFAEKRRIFVQTVQELQQDHDFVTLREAATVFQEEVPL